MENKLLAIFDLIVKISKNTPVDICEYYSGTCGEMDIRIYWDGLEKDRNRVSSYSVPYYHEVRDYIENEISADDMLRILEEIWAGRNG